MNVQDFAKSVRQAKNDQDVQNIVGQMESELQTRELAYQENISALRSNLEAQLEREKRAKARSDRLLAALQQEVESYRRELPDREEKQRQTRLVEIDVQIASLQEEKARLAQP